MIQPGDHETGTTSSRHRSVLFFSNTSILKRRFLRVARPSLDFETALFSCSIALRQHAEFARPR